MMTNSKSKALFTSVHATLISTLTYLGGHGSNDNCSWVALVNFPAIFTDTIRFTLIISVLIRWFYSPFKSEERALGEYMRSHLISIVHYKDTKDITQQSPIILKKKICTNMYILLKISHDPTSRGGSEAFLKFLRHLITTVKS